ncbi:MAG: PASTA domain-containing protein [Desulfobulbaceae bacterium]|nr:PASTA domain-containing protein [Desulfobulbaceae bacterium]
MAKRSRLRVQNEKRGRRILIYLSLLGLIAVICFQLERQYQGLQHLQRLFSTAKKTLSQKSLVRGTIYDRNLKQFAVTMERVAVFVRTREIDSITDTAIALASTLSLDSNRLIDKMESGALRLWVAEDISQEQEDAVKQLNLSGVYFQKDEKRYYPHGNQAAHLIGFVEDGIGLSGVEFHYDRLLATRKRLQQEEQKPLTIGQDLVLTIDLKIQAIVEGLVKKIVSTTDVVKVAAYLLESESGQLIAGAQYPGFDPNSFTRYNRKAIENMFFDQLFMPDDFRLFLRDSASFWPRAGNDNSAAFWSLAPAETGLGKQLYLWENLQLGGDSKTDFFTEKKTSVNGGYEQVRVKQDSTSFGLIPEKATPINLLTAFSVLLNGQFDSSPFVVKKVLDLKTGEEVSLVDVEKDSTEPKTSDSTSLALVKGLFQSQATFKDSGSYYFRDNILVATPTAGGVQQFMVNDLTFVTIPAGERDLNMLLVVERTSKGVARRNQKKLDVENIVDAKVQRISILQQVAGSVEDVFEIEVVDDGNYQDRQDLQKVRSKAKKNAGARGELPIEMPDLVGRSLRKSLRQLQGQTFTISIEGTGRVVRQHPLAGTSLKNVTSCRLILEKQENISPEKIAKDLRK